MLEKHWKCSKCRVDYQQEQRLQMEAMGQRAECVMLNKSTHILEAVKVLSELLSSEERHHIKKRDVFRDFTKQHGLF